MRDEKVAEEKKELDLQEMEWKLPHSTFMKEYKEEYKLLYKERLELAQTPVEDKDSQKKLEEQKEFQKKLEEKAKVPSTEAEEGMPYLAKRAAAVAVAAIDAKKLDRAAKAEDKRTPEQNLLVQALTLDHVGIPTAPLINNRFKPLLRRSQARPVEEELFV